MHTMTRVVFMGSPVFAVATLSKLGSAYDVVGVVTQPDRPAGRGRQLKAPAIKVLAEEMKLPFIQPQRLRAPEAMDQLRAWSPELIVVAAFGQILRPEVLALPPLGCINVHASLLPRWRGAAPIQAALLAGDAETGITIMKMDEGVDTGGILLQAAVPIGPGDTGGSLTTKLASLGADLLLEALPRYIGGELKPQPQENGAATYAPMLKKDAGLLDPTQPAGKLARLVMAFNPSPGAFLVSDGLNLKVHRAHAESISASPGRQLVYAGQPAIGTSDGILVLDEVQPAGKKPMEGRAFLAGARSWQHQP